MGIRQVTTGIPETAFEVGRYRHIDLAIVRIPIVNEINIGTVVGVRKDVRIAELDPDSIQPVTALRDNGLADVIGVPSAGSTERVATGELNVRNGTGLTAAIGTSNAVSPVHYTAGVDET